ncbi:hypothetical protein DFJ73DRAFT_248979 [Zopfochytrium polystomum]|nr:hypothetical protein DFJ73DRAFT_248979 [Zopfochytrium polystomum]
MLLAPLPSQPRSIPVLNPGTVPIVKVDRRTAATEDPTVNMKGGHALRVLKRENEELFKVNADLQLQIEQLQVSRQKVLDENAALAVELKEKNNKIAVLRKLELHESRNMRSQEEVETLLVAETSRRIRLETEARELRRALERCKGTEKEYRLIVDEATTTRSQHEDTIATQQKEVVRMQKRVKDMEFEVDELRVNVIKSERRCEDLEKRMLYDSEERSSYSSGNCSARGKHCFAKTTERTDRREQGGYRKLPGYQEEPRLEAKRV